MEPVDMYKLTVGLILLVSVVFIAIIIAVIISWTKKSIKEIDSEYPTDVVDIEVKNGEEDEIEVEPVEEDEKIPKNKRSKKYKEKKARRIHKPLSQRDYLHR